MTVVCMHNLEMKYAQPLISLQLKIMVLTFLMSVFLCVHISPRLMESYCTGAQDDSEWKLELASKEATLEKARKTKKGEGPVMLAETSVEFLVCMGATNWLKKMRLEA